MHDIVVLEAAQNVGDRIDLAQAPEELIAEPLPLRGAAHESRDIDEFERGRHFLRCFREARAYIEPLIRDGDAADIGLARRERIFRRLGRLRRGQRVEQGRFADIRQADNAAVETHLAPAQKRHDRARPGHPRKPRRDYSWMARSSPAMTLLFRNRNRRYPGAAVAAS